MGDGPVIEDGRLALFMIGGKAVTLSLAQTVKAGRADQVTTLELTGNELKALPDLKAFTKLQTLVLDKNKLSGKIRFPKLKELETLWMNGNELSHLESLIKDLRNKFPNLHYLSCMKNPSTLRQSEPPLRQLRIGVPDYFDPTKDMEDYNRYRLFVISAIGSLTFLDDQPISAEERAKAESVGKFQAVARPSAGGGSAGGGGGSPHAKDGGRGSLSLEPVDDALADAKDTDLASRGSQDSRAFLGYSPYKHLAHDSEGNRTIGSDDL